MGVTAGRADVALVAAVIGHSVACDDIEELDVRLLHVEFVAINVVPGCARPEFNERRQLPPRLLSKAGLISSME